MKFLNETRTNHNGYEYTVIGYNRETKRYTVHFTHNGVTKSVSMKTIQANVVSEKPTFETPRKSPEMRITVLFNNMRSRLRGRKSYADVKLDPRWETFEGFRATIHLVPGFEQWLKSTGYELDHNDKKQNTYGPESCKFLTKSENASLPRKSSKPNRYPIGTRLQNRHGQWFTVVGKRGIKTHILFEETGELREIFTNAISDNVVGKSKGE